jgi:hypothetical protein
LTYMLSRHSSRQILLIYNQCIIIIQRNEQLCCLEKQK